MFIGLSNARELGNLGQVRQRVLKESEATVLWWFSKSVDLTLMSLIN